MSYVKLFLVRHGETQENIDGTVQGWLDSVLNDNGYRQAREASQKFDESISAIYSSDLKRCTQTAKPFRTKFPDIPFMEDSRLRERNFGDAQGTNKGLHDWEVFWSSSDKVSIPNAETLDEYSRRVRDFIEEIKSKFKANEKILIITHGGTVNRVLDITKINEQYYPVKNCEALEIELP